MHYLFIFMFIYLFIYLVIYLFIYCTFHYKFSRTNFKNYESTMFLKNKSNKGKKVKIEKRDLVISRECGKTPGDETMKNKQGKIIAHIKLKI